MGLRVSNDSSFFTLKPLFMQKTSLLRDLGHIWLKLVLLVNASLKTFTWVVKLFQLHNISVYHTLTLLSRAFRG
jgi:hypothetical protein